MTDIEAITSSFKLTSDDCMAFISDHEGALRLATARLGYVVLGCFCHGDQLPPRHLLPPTRDKKSSRTEATKEGKDHESISLSHSSDSDSISSRSEGSVSEPGASPSTPPPAATLRRNRKRQVFEPEECERLCAACKPIFKKHAQSSVGTSTTQMNTTEQWRKPKYLRSGSAEKLQRVGVRSKILFAVSCTTTRR